MKNRWKTAFFILASAVCLCLIFILILFFQFIYSPKGEVSYKNVKGPTEGSPVFTIKAKKKELTQIANAELKDKNQGAVHYQVAIDNNVKLNGGIKIFAGEIPFQMVFSPKVTSLGNVVLYEKSVRIGKLYLPDDEVLRYIAQGTHLPKWIQIRPNQRGIYVTLSKFKIKKQYYLKAKKINLPKDDIEFALYKK